MLLKNISNQGLYLYAYTIATGVGKTGDASNITGSRAIDGGGRSALATTNPTEVDATNMAGVYWQALSQAETNGNAIAFTWKSATSGVAIDPILVFTSGVNLPAVAPGTSGGLAKIGTAPYPTSGTIAGALCDEINTGATHNINGSVGKQIRSMSATTDAIYSATLPNQSGQASTTIKLDNGASATDNIYQYDVISIISGTDAGDSRIITGYVGSTRVATVDRAWTTQPDGTSVFEITPTAMVRVADATTIADAMVGRNIEGGSSAGRTVGQAFAFLRNRWTISAGTLTVYATDDTTPLWTSVIARAAGDPITASDPG